MLLMDDVVGDREDAERLPGGLEPDQSQAPRLQETWKINWKMETMHWKRVVGADAKEFSFFVENFAIVLCFFCEISQKHEKNKILWETNYEKSYLPIYPTQ